MVQVMRTMTEVSTNETLLHLAQLAKGSLEDTRYFWETAQEDSKLLPLIDITSKSLTSLVNYCFPHTFSIAEQEEEANQRFRNLVTLHIRITLLSDVFATAGYTHGRSAIGLLQSLMNNMSHQVIADLGALHRVGIWENIVLNLGLKSKGISFLRSQVSSSGRNLGRLGVNLPEHDDSVNPNELNGDLNSADGAEPMITTASSSLSVPLTGPREQNSAAIKHLTSGLPASLAPFFQGNWIHLFFRIFFLMR
jgi:E3 ubiquitin-protein ligase HUWE1